MPVSLHVQSERPPAISHGTPRATRFVGLNANGADNRSLSLVTMTEFMALRFSHCLRFPENPTRTNENTSDSAAQSSAPTTIGGEDVYLYEPLALEYIAAGVSAHHDVRILDMRLDKNLRGTLQTFAPTVVGTTAYTVHVSVVRRLSEEIKPWNPRVLIVVGGHHATVAPEDFISPFIDLIVIGEGIFVFRDIVARFDKGYGFEGIPGTAISTGAGVTRTASRPTEDLDACPLPDRSPTAECRINYHSEWMRPLTSIRTSKGCPYRCNFCALWKLTGATCGGGPRKLSRNWAQ